jgi:hypothetical protein
MTFVSLCYNKPALIYCCFLATCVKAIVFHRQGLFFKTGASFDCFGKNTG